MHKTLQNLLSQGVFYTGRKNAVFCLLLVLSVAITSRLYGLLNHAPAVLNLHTPLDSALPFLPVFVIPYISLYPYIAISLFCFLLLKTRYFQSACLAMLAVWFVSYACYYFLQSQVIRPVLTGTGFFTKAVIYIYAVDQPFNDFPSLHSSLSTILAVHWVRLNKPLGIALSIWTGLIVVSTVFIKQHYIADLLFGLALAFGACWLFIKFFLTSRSIEGS